MSKNGDGREIADQNTDKREIEFPVTYHLKAVMLGTENDDDNKEKLVKVFKKLNISYQYHDKKVSTKGAYVSFTYNITISNRPQMDNLYAELKKIKELKFAV